MSAHSSKVNRYVCLLFSSVTVKFFLLESRVFKDSIKEAPQAIFSGNG